MPRGDGTGPLGWGPMTGRGSGYCAGYPSPGYANPYGFRMGRGLGWGKGFARGRGWRPYQRIPAGLPYETGPFGPASMTKAQEKDFLVDQIQYLEKEIENLKTRLDEIREESQEK